MTCPLRVSLLTVISALLLSTSPPAAWFLVCGRTAAYKEAGELPVTFPRLYLKGVFQSGQMKGLDIHLSLPAWR